MSAVCLSLIHELPLFGTTISAAKGKKLSIKKRKGSENSLHKMTDFIHMQVKV